RAYARPESPIQAAVQATHTLVFLSTDGGAFGGIGAARFAESSPFHDHVVAVLNLDALAGDGAPRVEVAGDLPRSPAPTLVAPPAFDDRPGRLRLLPLARLGQAAQETLGSLDQGLELAEGTTSYVWIGNRILQGWAIELVLIALLIPFFVGAVDLFAYCRRRR